MATKVGVMGAAGRMGATVCAVVHADPDLELVAAADAVGRGQSIRSVGGPDTGLSIGGRIADLVEAGSEVVVDFTVASAARQNTLALAAAGVHAVVGTSGLTDDDIARFEDAFVNSNCLVAPNFAISAVLMIRFAELAAPFFDTAEVIEYHHNQKVDAPSGTARETVRRLSEASDEWDQDPTQDEAVAGARGGAGPAGIRVHGVRMKGMLAHQDVILGAEGQTLTIRQDSYDRSSFMPGVILACKKISDHPGVTVGLDKFLGV
ncbi:MAG: 4-hydroxy-tetrahydrodipicolinate reductase [Acidimicrobiales bacterium]